MSACAYVFMCWLPQLRVTAAAAGAAVEALGRAQVGRLVLCVHGYMCVCACVYVCMCWLPQLRVTAAAAGAEQLRH